MTGGQTARSVKENRSHARFASATLGRHFLAGAATSLAALPLASDVTNAAEGTEARAVSKKLPAPGKFPVRVISSDNGLEALRKAYDLLTTGSDTLEAVVAGVTIVEDDPNENTVGLGGLPNEEGVVQLDAAVMHGPTHRAGAVAVERIRNPAKVAKLVMEQTDHVLLVGEGALRFARHRV